MSKLYMAYGSNLNMAQMRRRCPDAKVAGTGELKNYELVFRGGVSGVATVEPREGGTVPVLLWRISPRDERALDAYEGYPRLYEKETLTPEVEGEPCPVMAYVMTPGHALALPSPGYLRTIQEGYEDCGFSPAALEAGVSRTLELIHREPEWEEALEQTYRLQGW